MRKILSLLIIVLLASACSNSLDPKNCCTIIDIGIAVKYLNEDGENLLDIPGGIKESDIKVYHKIDGEWVHYYEANLDYPSGVRSVPLEDGTYLMIFASPTIDENNYSETKIEFSEGDFDIIKSEIYKTDSSEIITKVWYNDVLKWESGVLDRSFEIVR